VTTLAPEAPARLTIPWLIGSIGLLLGVMALAAAIGPATISPGAVLGAVVDRLPGIGLDTGLTERQLDILWLVRFPRIVLGALVGAMLAMAGAAYQGVFRNPLADPYLLGVAAGAGLGATLVIVTGVTIALPAAAFVGAVGGVALTYGLGRTVRSRSTTSLILAGVAVASFLTAAQTYVQQRNAETIREVFAWILGRLSTDGWSEVSLILPYVAVSAVVILAHRRLLDTLAVGDDEAAGLGVPVRRVRLSVVLAATLGTAAAVAVAGLIAFVGIIVPHAIRLIAGSSYRIVLPLAGILGAAFMVGADLVARTALSPAELPIGVVTAFLGGPFFIVVLRTNRGLA
jgi:iron complex transport system permease protein